MINLIAILSGITVNYFFGGIPFTPMLCVIAAILLILPPLLEIHYKDLLTIKKFPKILYLNLIINYLIFPLVGVGLSYLIFGKSSVLYAFLLLSLLSGGGLVMSWITKTGANTKLGFNLFVLNLIIFTAIFFPIDFYLQRIGHEFMMNPSEFACDATELTKSFSCGSSAEGGVSPFSGLLVLVLFPFILSRILNLFPKISNFIIRKKNILTQIGSFSVIFYIFALKQLHLVFSMDILYLSKIFALVILVYSIMFAINFFIFKKLGDSPESRSLFWIGITRFLTLGLIFSFLYAQYFSTSFMLVFAISYLVQIGFSTIFAKLYFRK
ncbi:MAG: hypothetical protein PHZ26_01680 [Candidatus Gracilibacteria bacterium]|nr:hypothetical protein [Candidatus Gracilibacteria bacterium]MDD2908444.1 hypothetical protein [Candidatus Gracilibacteria bacterium]